MRSDGSIGIINSIQNHRQQHQSGTHLGKCLACSSVREEEIQKSWRRTMLLGDLLENCRRVLDEAVVRLRILQRNWRDGIWKNRCVLAARRGWANSGRIN